MLSIVDLEVLSHLMQTCLHYLWNNSQNAFKHFIECPDMGLFAIFYLNEYGCADTLCWPLLKFFDLLPPFLVFLICNENSFCMLLKVASLPHQCQNQFASAIMIWCSMSFGKTWEDPPSSVVILLSHPFVSILIINFVNCNENIANFLQELYL